MGEAVGNAVSGVSKWMSVFKKLKCGRARWWMTSRSWVRELYNPCACSNMMDRLTSSLNTVPLLQLSVGLGVSALGVSMHSLFCDVTWGMHHSENGQKFDDLFGPCTAILSAQETACKADSAA